MSKTTMCTPEKLLEGFAKLSPDDQERVRAALGKGGAGPGRALLRPGRDDGADDGNIEGQRP